MTLCGSKIQIAAVSRRSETIHSSLVQCLLWIFRLLPPQKCKNRGWGCRVWSLEKGCQKFTPVSTTVRKTLKRFLTQKSLYFTYINTASTINVWNIPVSYIVNQILKTYISLWFKCFIVLITAMTIMIHWKKCITTFFT